MKQQIRTVSDLYPSPWLYPEDLAGKRVTVTITAVAVEDVHNPRTHTDEPRIILDFGRSKRMILNKTQAYDVADVAGSETLAEWPGTALTLAPGIAPNKKPTIAVGRPARQAPAPPVDEEPEAPVDADPEAAVDEEPEAPVAGPEESPTYADGTPVPLAVHAAFLAYVEHQGHTPTPTEFWPWLHSAEGQALLNGNAGLDMVDEYAADDDDDDDDPIADINADLFGD